YLDRVLGAAEAACWAECWSAGIADTPLSRTPGRQAVLRLPGGE
ncbi:MAG: hypothetical protein QOK26_1931, partial [Pseudonocardiales bacterium]|nr:hypothetical protein [Pseudonocardiales bacterium]